jgi:acetyl-CoA synthetase
MGPDLTRLLHPRSVAVVGATDRPGTYAHMALTNLAAAGFVGTVTGVHPVREEVMGVRCVRRIDQPYDAVVIATPAATVADYLRQARAVGCGGAVVFAAGFAEAGRLDLHDQLVAAAGDMPVVGPNGNGLVSVAGRAPLWGDAVALPDAPGPIAVITQSGNVGVLALAHRGGLGLHTVISLGNAASVTASTALAQVATLDGVRAIALYLESDGDGADLAEALAVCADRDVRIAALKVGRTATSRRIGVAHTAALAGDARVFAALVREAGGVLAVDLPELLEAARMLAAGSRAPGAVVIATASGGDAAIAADIAGDVGLVLANVPDDDPALAEVLPANATATNPLDHTNQIWADTEAVAAVMAALADRHDVAHAVYIQDQPPGLPPFAADEWESTRAGAILGAARCGIRALIVSTMPGQEPRLDDAIGAVVGLRAAFLGLAALQLPAPSGHRLREIAAFARSATLAVCPAAPHEVSVPTGGAEVSRALSEAQAKDWLAEMGIEVPRGRVCPTASAAAAAAAEIGGHLVCKLVAPGAAHISDIGGVVVGVAPRDVEQVAEHLLLLNPAAEVLVEELVYGELEMIAAVSRNGVVPHLLVGRGGRLAEIDDDTVTVPLPVSAAQCKGALASLRCAPLMDGYRGGPAVDVEAFSGLLTRLSEAFGSSDWVTVELNPVIVATRGAVAVDAWIAGADHRPMPRTVES